MIFFLHSDILVIQNKPLQFDNISSNNLLVIYYLIEGCVRPALDVMWQNNVIDDTKFS